MHTKNNNFFRAIVLIIAMLAAACDTVTAPSLPPPSDLTSILTSKDANTFLLDVSTYDWGDAGARAAEVFGWISEAATSSDPQAAQDAGKSAHAIAVFLADKKDQLLDITSGLFGRNHTTLGARNPDLVRAFAKALIPYQGALVCDDRDVPGFDSIEPCNGAMPAANSVFSLVQTDAKAAADFSDAAHARAQQYVQTFADTELSSPDIYPAAQGLTYAGSLLGLLAVADRNAGLAMIDISRESTQARYTIASAILARAPGSSLPENFFSQGVLMTPEQVQKHRGDSAYAEYASGLINFLTQQGVETFVNHNLVGRFKLITGES